MFDKINLNLRPQNGTKRYKVGHILPVLDAASLLGGSRYQSYIERLKHTCNIPDKYFDLLYLPLVQQFSEFVQLIPSQYQSALGGLLNEGLATGLVALEQEYENRDMTDPLINYAIYSAGLLKEISKVFINQRIVLCEEKGKFIDYWRPLSGPMVGKANFYKIYPMASSFQRVENAITPLLARQLIPMKGFIWLSSDLKVFADWLEALMGGASTGGIIAHILSLFRQDKLMELLNRFQQVSFDVEMAVSEGTIHAEAFYNWLKEGIANGDIKFNTHDSSVHVLAEGTLLEDKLFKEFADRYKQANMNTIKGQFRDLLGSPDKSGSEFAAEQQYVQQIERGGVESGSFLGSRADKGIRLGIMLPSTMVHFQQVPSVSPLMAATQGHLNHSLPSVSVDSAPQQKIK